jgi:D-alanyl-D-alanine carboxypeptidase
MKKTVLCLLLSLLLIPLHGIAETSESTGFDLGSLAEDTVFLANLEDPTQSILGLERNADKKRYPASTTKIMTCIIALEESEPDEFVSVSKRACNLSGRNSKMGLEPGEHFRMIDLLYGLMLPSGNDAAIAIAEHIGGSIDGFAELMNRKAEELGMEHSHFMNPHGLHHDNHYTTARDLALLAAYAMENETFREIVSTAKHTVKSKEGRKLVLKNANRMLRDMTAETYKPYSCLYENAIGIKTGDTHLAGKCLVAAAKKNGTTYLLVLLNGQNAPEKAKGLEKDKYAAQRFYDAIELFEYAFEHDTVSFGIDELRSRSLPETYAAVPDPDKTLVTEVLYRIEWNEADELTLPRWIADELLRDPLPEDVIAYTVDSYRVPVGEKAGTASIVLNGLPVFTGDLIVEEYTYPPTPEPTEEPVYIVVDETPLPTAAPTPGAAVSPSPSWIPIPTENPTSGPWFFRLLRCGGCSS